MNTDKPILHMSRHLFTALGLAIALISSGCNDSGENSGENSGEDSGENQAKKEVQADSNSDHLSKPVVFRGFQFTTVVPGGWVVSFPQENTRYQIGKLANENAPAYQAIIRLDAGRPTEDLTSTTEALRTRFNLTETTSEFDWGGQKAVLLEGASQGIMKPQRIVCTIRLETLFMLFVAKEKDVDLESDFENILENWEWDEQ